jgi:hypothetical protein
LPGTKVAKSGAPSFSMNSRELSHSLGRPMLQVSPVQTMWSSPCAFMSAMSSASSSMSWSSLRERRQFT